MEITSRAGDSIWYYSQLFDIDLCQLEKSNTAAAQNQLQEGQKLRIPGYIKEVYIVSPGDTSYQIAINNKIPHDSLLLLNPSIYSSFLQPGQILLLPRRVTENKQVDRII